MKNKNLKNFAIGTFATILSAYSMNADAQSLRERREARQEQPTQTEQVTPARQTTTPEATYQTQRQTQIPAPTTRKSLDDRISSLKEEAISIEEFEERSIGSGVGGFGFDLNYEQVPLDSTVTAPFRYEGQVKVGEIRHVGDGKWEYEGPVLQDLDLGDNYFTATFTVDDRARTELMYLFNIPTYNLPPVLGTLKADFTDHRSGEVLRYEVEPSKSDHRYRYGLGEPVPGRFVLTDLSLDASDPDDNMVMDNIFVKIDGGNSDEFYFCDVDSTFNYSRPMDDRKGRGSKQYEITSTFVDEWEAKADFVFYFKKEYDTPKINNIELLEKSKKPKKYNYEINIEEN